MTFQSAKRLVRRGRSHNDGGHDEAVVTGESRPSLSPPAVSHRRTSSQSRAQVVVQTSSTHQSVFQTTRGPPQTDSLGLHVVYTPVEAAKADIVFVHGLGGTSCMTWSKNKNIELFWPKMFLPVEEDLCQARVLTFGYNSAVTSTTSSSSRILDFAKDLLFEMKYGRDVENRELRIGEVRARMLSSRPGRRLIGIRG